MNHFTEALGLSRYTLYMQDYGGPVGFRMALAHPDRIEALIVQDAVSHNEGLGAIWKARRAFWADRAANESVLRANLLSPATARTRHVDAYQEWQAWMQEKQPRLLVIWGKYDLSFDLSEPEAYRQDIPNAEVHLLDAGHFALDTKADESAALVDQFMKAQK
jgi:pimeloyl-ACP methyl ester carboxylesterase